MAVVLLCAAACSVPAPTWHQDIAPIVADHCMSCHRAGGIAPFALTDYDSVREQAHRMLDQIERGAMPPFSARSDAECAPRYGWDGDPRLSDAEKATLQQWMASGYLLGDPSAPPPIAYHNLARVTESLVPEEGWIASGDHDQFICNLFDVGNTDVAWLSGLQIQPEHEDIVHHALIYALEPEFAEPFVAEHGIGRPFVCSGGFPADFQFHAWFPGNQPLQLPAGMAMPLVPGTKIAVQLHYHPHGGVYGADRTSIDLELSPSPPEQLYFGASFGNQPDAPTLLPGPGDTEDGVPEFVVPKNTAEHHEHMRQPVPNFEHGREVRVVSVLPHMHLLGTGLALTLERRKPRGAAPRVECLSNTGWNFDWQRTYAYHAPFDHLPVIADGDVLDIKCTWNNTIQNPFLQRLLADTNGGMPFDVPLGEETVDEMCLTILGLAQPAPRDLSAQSIARILAGARVTARASAGPRRTEPPGRRARTPPSS